MYDVRAGLAPSDSSVTPPSPPLSHACGRFRSYLPPRRKSRTSYVCLSASRPATTERAVMGCCAAAAPTAISAAMAMSHVMCRNGNTRCLTPISPSLSRRATMQHHLPSVQVVIAEDAREELRRLQVHRMADPRKDLEPAAR